MIYNAELVHLHLRKVAEWQFPVTAPLHFPEVVDCLMVQYQLAVSIELAPLAIVIAGDHIHLFTPLSWGNEVGSPFPLTRRTQSRSLPAKSLLFENFSKNFFEAGLSSENSKKRPVSRNGPAGRRSVLWRRLLTWYSSYSKPAGSDGGATLFLTGADHEYCEIKRRTRQNNLQSATMSLQVVIGLCKRKETAALISQNRRPNMQSKRTKSTCPAAVFSFPVGRGRLSSYIEIKKNR